MLVNEQALKAACHVASTSWTLSGDKVYRLYKEVGQSLKHLSGTQDEAPSPRAQALEEIVAARKAHVDAVDAYNSRLAVIKSAGVGCGNVDHEYRLMSDAQSEFIRVAQSRADEILSGALSALSSQPVADGWLSKAQELYQKCNNFPENSGEGFMALLQLRNHVADILPASPGASE